MTKVERVMAAIQHQTPDRVPTGEIHIQPGLCCRLLGKEYPQDYQHFERDATVRKLLGMDVVNMGEWPEWEEGTTPAGERIVRTAYGQTCAVGAESRRILEPPVPIEEAESYRKPDSSRLTGEAVERFAKETDLFVFGQIGGPVTQLDEMYPMEDYMVYCLTNPREIFSISRKVMEYEVEKAKLFLEKGAHAILIGDDIAFNSGVFLPPAVMQRLVYPFYRWAIAKIREFRDVPIFLHSDGNLNGVLDQIVACGFDGIQSLQPSAGMDIGRIKKQYGDRLCLWGNIDLNYVMSMASPEEVRRNVRETIEAAAGNGGHILSTCNAMIDAIPEENIYAMMEEAGAMVPAPLSGDTH